jgi:hypothetical protein
VQPLEDMPNPLGLAHLVHGLTDLPCHWVRQRRIRDWD